LNVLRIASIHKRICAYENIYYVAIRRLSNRVKMLSNTSKEALRGLKIWK